MTGRAARLAGAYLVFAAAWILLSDWLLFRMGPSDFVWGQTAKGLLFVVSTALLIYLLTSREIRSRKEVEADQTRLERRLSAAARLEAMGQLAGGIAHDFNNLLTAISGNIEAYLSERDEAGGAIVELHEARDAAHRAAELTRQLLAFGRPRLRQSQSVEVNDVIADMSGLLERLISSTVRIETDLAEDLGVVTMDRGRLEQVVMNLSINARDAMPRGGTLRLSTSPATVTAGAVRALDGPLDAGTYVRLDVSDTGVGMTDEVQARMFDAFYTTKPSGAGTGLGLPTVQSIVADSGGGILVRSEPGAGTTFTVFLPAAARSTPSASEARDPVANPAVDGSECLLVAEDDRAVRSLVVRILERRGFNVLEASNGTHALEVLRGGDGARVDMIITDANMPEMGGLELIAAAKVSNPELRALLISGSPDEEFDTEVPFLAKPFTAAQLAGRVREVLDG